MPKIAGTPGWAVCAVEAVDPVDDSVHLDGVVGLNAGIAGGVVIAGRRAGQLRVDFGCEQVVDAFSRRAAENLIGWVLVGPGGEAAGLLDDLEDGVGAEILMRVDWLAWPLTSLRCMLFGSSWV